jgi:phage tail-like protein
VTDYTTATTIFTSLSISPVDYNGLNIAWTIPTGDWSQFLLLRSGFGPPLNVEAGDGVTLFSAITWVSGTAYVAGTYVISSLTAGIYVCVLGTSGTTDPSLDATHWSLVTSFTDTDLRSGYFYYYSVIVYATGYATPQYVIAGQAQGLVLTNWDFASTYMSFLPDFYAEDDTTGDLANYFALLGYETDWSLSEIESLFLFSNPELISGAVLPDLAANLGMTYEPQLGVALSRQLVSNAVFLYKNKGTVTGIAATASAYSGYPCVVTIGPNLAIQLDDGAFDSSVGHWVGGNSVSVVSHSTAAALSVTPAHVSYNPIPSPASITTGETGYLPVHNENVGVVQVNTNSSTLWLTTCTPATATTLGIPIGTATELCVAVRMRMSSGTAFSVAGQIDWYASNGALISSTVGSTQALSSSAWSTVYAETNSIPAGAVTFGFSVKSTATISTTQIALLDAYQPEVSTSPSSWSPPRDIRLNLQPVRRQLVDDPVGLGGGYNWATSGGELAASSAAITWPANTTRGYILTGAPITTGLPGASYPGAAIPGMAGMQAETIGGTVSAGEGNLVVSTTASATPGVAYSWSVYMQALAALQISQLLQIFLAFYDGSTLLSSPPFNVVFTTALTTGDTYTSLPITAFGSSYFLTAGQPITLILAGSAQTQTVRVSQAVSAGATSIPVYPFVATAAYTAAEIGYVSFVDVVGSWVRSSITDIVAPATTTTVEAYLVISEISTGEQHYLGAPLLEPSSSARPYFDANFSPSTDYLPEGTANQSPTDYYPNCQAVLTRLVSVMPQYMPLGATFSLVTGATALAA